MEIAKRIESPNFVATSLPRKIKYIILHFTEVDFDEAIRILTCKKKGVSCHYVVHRSGDIYSLVNEANIALHAGRSSWKNDHEINDISLGIEIDNSGREEFSQKQMCSLVELCKELSQKYNIPRENIIGHSDIASSRKIDPGIYFDWGFLNENSLGIEFQKPTIDQNKILYNWGDSGKNIEELQMNLSKLGYRIYITGIFDKKTSDVVRAFQSHFCPEVILERGGVSFYNNSESVFVWDSISDFSLKNLTQSNNL